MTKSSDIFIKKGFGVGFWRVLEGTSNLFFCQLSWANVNKEMNRPPKQDTINISE